MNIYTKYQVSDKVLFFLRSGELVSLAQGTIATIRINAFKAENAEAIDVRYGVKSCGIIVDVHEDDIATTGYQYVHLTLGELEERIAAREEAVEAAKAKYLAGAKAIASGSVCLDGCCDLCESELPPKEDERG